MYNQFGYSNYGTYQQPFAQYQARSYQPMQQPQQIEQNQDVPFAFVRFGTLDEAKAYLIPPTKSVMFIKSDFSEFYIKSADTMGNPMLEVFNCSKQINNTNNNTTSEIQPNFELKQGDLDKFGVLTKENTKNFATLEQIKGIEAKIEQLKKEI